MKKITYYIGYIAVLLSVASVVFKIHHLDYAGTVISVALIILSIYFPLYILDKYQDQAEGKTSAEQIVAALCTFVITLGLLFKLNHWPLAGTLLTVGLVGFSLIFVPMFYIQKSKLQGTNNLMNVAGALGLSLFALGLLFKIQHWPVQMALLIAGAALVVLIYFPMYMMNSAIPDEKKVSHLRDTFFVVIIGCFLILFAWGMIGMHVLPPSATPNTTEQSK